jgi:hypothetical protein
LKMAVVSAESDWSSCCLSDWMFMDGWFFFVFDALPLGGAPTIHHSYFNDLLDVSENFPRDYFNKHAALPNNHNVLCIRHQASRQRELLLRYMPVKAVEKL